MLQTDEQFQSISSHKKVIVLGSAILTTHLIKKLMNTSDSWNDSKSEGNTNYEKSK